MEWRKYIGLVVLLFSFCNSSGQLFSENIRQWFAQDFESNKAGLQKPNLVKSLYQKNNFKPIWFGTNTKIKPVQLQSEFLTCDELGLNERDYQYEFIRSLLTGANKLLNLRDSLYAELRLSDAAMHFYNDLAYGSSRPILGYDGIRYVQKGQDVPGVFLQYILDRRFSMLKYEISLSVPEIAVIQTEIIRINRVLQHESFKEPRIISGKVNNTNRALVIRLSQLGYLGDTQTVYQDSLLKSKLKLAQYQFNLTADGVLGKSTRDELNVPLRARKSQLIYALNYYRWLSGISQNQSVIIVNIPAAYLKVYDGKAVILEMKMIVGKKSTPTHTLSSTVNDVILYPYWHVPKSIVFKELLPIIKRSPGYIDGGGFQVLNSNGAIVNPYSVNWSSLGPGNFPYTIRQSTGCDNALGLLKLNFYNPFGAYLHDTNSKELFKRQKRFFSHGCMRMEKPMELGHLVLKDNPIAIDTLEQKGCLRNQSPIVVPADVHMPVIIWYNPVGTDARGRLIFFGDIYDKFNWR